MHFKKTITAIVVTLVVTLFGTSPAQASVLLRFIGEPDTGGNHALYYVKSNESVGQKFIHPHSETIESLDFLCGGAQSYDNTGRPQAIQTSVQVTFWNGVPGRDGLVTGVWNFENETFCTPGDLATTLTGAPITLAAGTSTVSFRFGDMGTYTAHWDGAVYPSHITVPAFNNHVDDGGMTYYDNRLWDDSPRSLNLRMYGTINSASGAVNLSEAEAETKAQEVLAECALDEDCSKWVYLISAFGESNLITSTERQCYVHYLKDYGSAIVQDAGLSGMVDDMQYTTGVASDLMNWFYQQVVVSRIASIPFPSAINIYDASTWSNPANKKVISDTILATGFQSTLSGISTPFQDLGLGLSAAANKGAFRASLQLNDTSFSC